MNSINSKYRSRYGQNKNAKVLTETLSPLITPLFFLVAAALIVISSPGCRFGNHKEESLPPPNPDTVSGFYDMTPQSVSVCMKKEGQSSETCVQPSFTKIPPGIRAILTDPIALIMVKPETGESVLKNPDSDNYIFTQVTKSGNDYGPTMSYSPTYPTQPLWETDDPCTLSMNRVEAGNYKKYDSARTEANGRSIVGRVQYNVKREWGFTGTCEKSLTVMAACYLSSEYCGGQNSVEDNELQTIVQNFFGPFIDAGAFSATDIPDLRMMRYEIQY